jgi:hypothetical protein
MGRQVGIKEELFLMSASVSELGRQSVEQARETRRKIEIECSQKQEELRELVGVRYKDFIEAADTIAAMGIKAQEILSIASTLGELSNRLVSVSCDLESVDHVQNTQDLASKARDIFEITHASEKVSFLSTCSPSDTCLPLPTD